MFVVRELTNIGRILFTYDAVILPCCGCFAGFVLITVDRGNFKYSDDCISDFNYILKYELILVLILSG